MGDCSDTAPYNNWRTKKNIGTFITLLNLKKAFDIKWSKMYKITKTGLKYKDRRLNIIVCDNQTALKRWILHNYCLKHTHTHTRVFKITTHIYRIFLVT